MHKITIEMTPHNENYMCVKVEYAVYPLSPPIHKYTS